MRTTIFFLLSSFLVLCLTGCGSDAGAPLGGANSDGFGVNLGASVSTYSFNEESQTCLNEEGEQGYNQALGECSDLTSMYTDEVESALVDGVDLTGSNATGVDFSGLSEVNEEYILVNKLNYDDSTVLGDGSYAEKTHMESQKSSLCSKWLSKKNKKTGLYPSGIQKKIERLNCL